MFEQSINHAVFFHNILKNITWISGDLNKNYLIDEARKTGATTKESKAWSSQFFEILEGCEIRKILKKPEKWIESVEKRSVDVLNEIQVVGKNKSGAHYSGVIDRLEVYREDGAVIRAKIIDWKSDSLDARSNDDFILILNS